MLRKVQMTLWALPLAWGASAKSQDTLRLMTGTVTERANLELVVFKRINKKTEMIAEYKVTPDHNNYAFIIPEDKNASFHLLVNVMKDNGRRLVFDKMLTFPLKLTENKITNLNIIPSKLDTIKKRGLEVAAHSNINNLCLVRGVLTNSKVNGPVSLERVVNGKMQKVASFNVTSNKRFALAIPVEEEGFYYLTTLRWHARVYLKPSDELEVEADAVTGLYKVIKGSEENRLMEEWQNLSLPITSWGYNINIYQNGVNMDQYIDDYVKLQPAITSFRQKNGISNQRFKQLLYQAISIDNQYAPLRLLSNATRRKSNSVDAAPRNTSEPPAFFQQFIGNGKFNDAAMLEVGETMEYLQLYTKLILAFEPERKNLFQAEQFTMQMDAIANDNIRSVFFEDQMNSLEVNNLTEFREVFEPFKQYAVTATGQKKYHQLSENFLADTAWIGKSSYNFELPDTKGRMVTMKDFKGKVVFIDVWATWCGPCKEQFPFMKEIEEEYKDNKDIVFIGISIDRAQDKEKWLLAIKKYDLTPIQLFDDAAHGFGRKYGILSIPRFLLIDKEGNWIEIRCPRPSDKENLKRYLDKALQR